MLYDQLGSSIKIQNISNLANILKTLEVVNMMGSLTNFKLMFPYI